MSTDGYIIGPNGEMDWIVWDWDDRFKKYVFELTEPVDTIILWKMTVGEIAINPDKFDKLITALRTAIDNKEAT